MGVARQRDWNSVFLSIGQGLQRTRCWRWGLGCWLCRIGPNICAGSLAACRPFAPALGCC